MSIMPKPLLPSLLALFLWPAEIKDEAYTSLMIKHDNPPVDGALRIKVDTGAAGNRLPVRIYKQMFGNIPKAKVLQPEPSTDLQSYSGHCIECLGLITLDVHCKSQTA